MSDRAYTLITGASSKIGQCLALRLAGSSRLILHARNSTALDQLRARCTSSDEHLTWCCDLKRLEDIGSSLTALLASNQAKVGAFVHCAGVLQLHRWGVLPAIVAAGTPAVRSTTFSYTEHDVTVSIEPRFDVAELAAPGCTPGAQLWPSIRSPTPPATNCAPTPTGSPRHSKSAPRAPAGAVRSVLPRRTAAGGRRPPSGGISTPR